ncbi:DUF1778 domain-containing protein [Leucothrix mucor]|uniref:type II toxin-antitoxin system TacA family antitoxin n=1 Tax=Leucothrix mucor TaxID=45248 RepID=UPI0003B46663|nr:DUF1778 domain-containing protein [Leucothrix mucor]
MATSILSVRVTDDERGLIEAAAANARVKLSDFVRRKTLEAAEETLMNRRVIEIPANKWSQIETLLTAPAKAIPAVQELSQFKPTWEN